MSVSKYANTISDVTAGASHHADLPNRSQAQKPKQPAISAIAAAAYTSAGFILEMTSRATLLRSLSHAAVDLLHALVVGIVVRIVRQKRFVSQTKLLYL